MNEAVPGSHSGVPGGQDIREHLAKIQPQFFLALSELRDAILASMIYTQFGTTSVPQSASPESLPKVNLCGYSAVAITEGLRQKFGAGVANMVFGKHDTGPYHYWTQANAPDESLYVDGTHVMFNPAHAHTIVVDNNDKLADYGLSPYVPGTDMRGDTTVARLEVSGNILPIAAQLDVQLAKLQTSQDLHSQELGRLQAVAIDRFTRLLHSVFRGDI